MHHGDILKLEWSCKNTKLLWYSRHKTLQSSLLSLGRRWNFLMWSFMIWFSVRFSLSLATPVHPFKFSFQFLRHTICFLNSEFWCNSVSSSSDFSLFSPWIASAHYILVSFLFLLQSLPLFKSGIMWFITSWTSPMIVLICCYNDLITWLPLLYYIINSIPLLLVLWIVIEWLN